MLVGRQHVSRVTEYPENLQKISKCNDVAGSSHADLLLQGNGKPSKVIFASRLPWSGMSESLRHNCNSKSM